MADNQPPIPSTVDTIKALKKALEDNDLAKQVFADANAADRQSRRDHFEARVEFAKQAAQLNLATQKAVTEYGLQTLKWLFLLNAGAIALILTLAGGRAADARLSLIAQLAKPIALFALGCVLVVAAGAAGFFNFFRAGDSLPSLSSLHQFLSPTAKEWPVGRAQLPTESDQEFFRRIKGSLDRTNRVGVVCASGSAFCFFAGAVWAVLVGLH
jgi:hypothetical protein